MSTATSVQLVDGSLFVLIVWTFMYPLFMLRSFYYAGHQSWKENTFSIIIDIY